MPKNDSSVHVSSLSGGRVSAPACKKGSITVEAAMAVPIFFFAVICLLYLMEIMAVRTSIRAGLQSAGKQVMQDVYVTKAVIPSEVEAEVVHAAGPERLARSIVIGGSSGIHCEGSYISASTGIGKLVAKYEIRIPVPIFGIPPISYEETMRIKAWTGYEKSYFGSEDDTIVYITETGIVYHRDYQCTYLDLSIHMATLSEVPSLRNESGGKYYPCEHCARGAGDCVYITDSGDRYHNSLSCSGLKRTIYAVPISEAVGKGVCSRCGG